MTENQFHNHAEQMEAVRRDFQILWHSAKAQMIAQGYDSKTIAEKEIEEWNRFRTDEDRGDDSL